MYSLINNTSQKNLLDELKESLKECKSFYFNVAFISFSGIQLLLESFQKADQEGIKGKVITGTYLNFTDPKAIRNLQKFQGLDIRIFLATEQQGFHPKAYIFEYDDYFKVIIGSSNLTNFALKSNIEWNLKVITKEDTEDEKFLSYLIESFEQIWDNSSEASEKLLNEYEKFLANQNAHGFVEEPRTVFHFPLEPRLKPNSMQVKAVDGLSLLRAVGESRALAVAATGTGKTYLAAFDVKKTRPKKMLFLAHRENILGNAKESFAKVVDVPSSKMGILSGMQKNYKANYLFATIQTMSRDYKKFKRDEFDYIIVDEAHHATSPSYKKVLEYFNSSFLLGMTATPERSDEGNVFDLFNNNLAVNIRLREALQAGLLVPFHYYGITDQSGVDLSNSTLNPHQIAEKLNVTRRVDFVIEQMNFYDFDGLKRRALGFCITKKHAEFMAEEFTKRGIPSTFLTGDSSEHERERQIKLLESDVDSLNVIFTVDIFNEGIDIPSVNTILMLRPTESPIIFTQQLGRGLRKANRKGFLTVLDFIGNYSKSFLIAIALNGSRTVTKKTITHDVRTGFRSIPGPSNIQMDEIAKEQILTQLEQENFYSLKYLKDDYLSFKNNLGGRVPYHLQDYVTLEGAPDPVLFFSKSVSSNKSDNYLEFLNRMEKNNGRIKTMIEKKDFMKIYTLLSRMIPLKRPHEFAILELALKKKSFQLQDSLKQLEHFCEGDQKEAVLHSLETFQLQYADKKEREELQLIREENTKYNFHPTYIKVLEDTESRLFIEDLLNYGLLRYQTEFGRENYGYPFLKLYAEYTQREVGLMTNYRNAHSSFRGSTLVDKTNGDHFFLFIDLHKEEEIDDRMNYKDKFISRKQFQWESPNATKSTTVRGKDLTLNKERGKKIHLFVRKYKEVNKVRQRYTYIGTGDSISFQNEKPIEIQYQLHQKIPLRMYEEFEPE